MEKVSVFKVYHSTLDLHTDESDICVINMYPTKEKAVEWLESFLEKTNKKCFCYSHTVWEVERPEKNKKEFYSIIEFKE